MQSDLAADQALDRDETEQVSDTVIKIVHALYPSFLSTKLEDQLQVLSRKVGWDEYLAPGILPLMAMMDPRPICRVYGDEV